MAQRKISATQLAEEVGITLANLSILKTTKQKPSVFPRWRHYAVPCIASPQIYWSMQKKKIVRRKTMNQRPMENKPLSSSKPPAYIPPVKRLGQIPPLQQPPVQPLRSKSWRKTKALTKSDSQNMSDPRIGSNVSTPQTDPPVSQPASVSDPGTVPAAKQTVPAAAGGGSKTSSAPRSSQAIPPGYYRPIPRKQRADYQYLAKRSLFQGLSRCSVLLFVLLGFQ